MIGKTLSHFRIVDKLGEGGMGVVYRAEDQKLGRHVALKVLQSEFTADEERRQRFIREARTAAAVTHPNIASVHEIGEADGVIFIALELVEGAKLAQRISAGTLQVEECLRIALEIGEGLGHAHEGSIVHRDLKPDNIHILDNGHVKILDFGLAKLYQDPAESATGTSGLQTISAAVTRDGRILGTVAYMSPEQARGLEVDARSDIFSLGIVLYEMLTGHKPFSGQTITDTLTSILRDEQPPIARYNPSVPMEFERILGRCLEKDPDDRYATVAELMVDLRHLKRITDSHSQPVPLVSDPDLRRRRDWPSWLRPGPVLAGALLAIVTMGVIPYAIRSWSGSAAQAAAPEALAVLPFDNLQQRDDPERMGQILQELIITDLSELSGPKVLSSQRLFDIQKQLGRENRGTIDRDMATQVAQQAGARLMLTGTLSRIGEKWIVTCQLIDVRDGTVIKSERLDGDDLFGMTDELTALVRSDLGASDSTIELAVRDRTSSSLDAYQDFLDGVDLLNRLEFARAADAFQEAIDIDPSFGQAYYKLAISRWWSRSFDAYELGSKARAPGEVLSRMLAEGNVKLTRKDRKLAEAFYELVEQRPNEAQPLFAEAVEDYPDEKEAWYGLGESIFHGKGDSQTKAGSLEAFERAIELDPEFRLAYYHVVDVFAMSERYDEGIARIREFIEDDPGNISWHQDLARLAIAQGDGDAVDTIIEESLAVLESDAERREYLSQVGLHLSRGGFDDKAKAIFHRALEIDPEDSATKILLSHLAEGSGEYDESERLLREVIGADPQNLDAVNALFDLLGRQRRYGEAIDEARAMIDRNAGFETAYAQWIAAAIRKGDRREFDRAMRSIDRLLELSGDPEASHALIYGRAAKASFDVGDYVSAERFVRGCFPSTPGDGDGELHRSMGFVELYLGRPDAAIESFEKALAGTVPGGESLYGLLLAHSVAEDYDRAVETATEMDRMAHNPFARARLVETLLRAGELDEAAQLVELSRRKYHKGPPRITLYTELAMGYLRTGMQREAESLIHEAESDLAGAPLPRKLAGALIWVHLAGGRHEDALAVVERALERAPDDAGLLEAQVAVMLSSGQAAEAERIARELVDRGPASASAHALLAYALAGQDRFDEAMPFASRAAEMHPDRVRQELLAWILVAGDRDVDEGIQLARAALEIPEGYDRQLTRLPFVASAEHTLGLAHLKQGRTEEAETWLERAARINPDNPLLADHLERARG